MDNFHLFSKFIQIGLLEVISSVLNSKIANLNTTSGVGTDKVLGITRLSLAQ